MKKCFRLPLLFVVASTALIAATDPLSTNTSATYIAAGDGVPLRFMSWNLRYDSMPNKLTVGDSVSSLPSKLPDDDDAVYYASSKEVPWSARRIGIAQEVLFSKPDILCVQEALVRQVQDLTLLLPSYTYVGVGRDDGVATGEFEAIFFRNDSACLLEWDSFWLSDTPFKPSKYPGAGSHRTATRARFIVATGTKDKVEFTIICTHWDDKSDAQRRLAASLIRYRVAYETATTHHPVFVLGDFNSPSTGPDSGAYKIMVDGLPPVTINDTFARKYDSGGFDRNFALVDVGQATKPMGRSGHFATFTAFAGREMTKAYQRIDFVMASPGKGWASTAYRVGETFFDTGVVSSDHRPLWVDVTLEAKK